MTAQETPDELRARLGELIAAVDFDLRLPITAATVEALFALAHAWPAIDAMLSQLSAAEADLDQILSTPVLRAERVSAGLVPLVRAVVAVAGRRHDEALALQERPS